MVLNLSATGLILANKTFVFDSQVLDHVGSLLQLDLNLMLLGLSSLQLRYQDILVDLDFSFTLLHGHLKLVLSILETKDLICLFMHFLLKIFDLQLHHIVLHQSLLLVLLYLLKVSSGHLILKSQLLDHIVQFVFSLLDFDDDSCDISSFILQVLVGSAEQSILLLESLQLLGQISNVLSQLILNVMWSDSLQTINLSFHLLDLEILLIEEFLLSLLLSLKLSDVSLKIPGSRQSTRDVTNKIGLRLSQLEE